MLTVAQVAQKVRRDPETVRRWIRSGKLRSRKAGMQHWIDEGELARLAATVASLPMPKAWRRTWTGEPQPDWLMLVARARRGH